MTAASYYTLKAPCASLERCRAPSALWSCRTAPSPPAPQPVPEPPDKVGFDRLWEVALRPAIDKAGYEPVRPNEDIGALIINEMIERLAISDLVLADVSIPNGNVYYEGSSQNLFMSWASAMPPKGRKRDRALRQWFRGSSLAVTDLVQDLNFGPI
jgi:hypothetical protein